MGCNTFCSVLVFSIQGIFRGQKINLPRAVLSARGSTEANQGVAPQYPYQVDLRRAECKGLYYWAETVLPRPVFIVENYTIQHRIPQNITIRAIRYLHIIVLRMPSHALLE